ncbi:glycosyltransferase [Bacillus sp. JJ1533]|uniref:glycosyltransferase n=1 Tax=Bacillus sp. JJ1533 TaxID=3122959 RepID=UPI002FFF041D
MQRKFPNNSNYYFIVGSISESFGGLTKSMLKRAKLFQEYQSVTPGILTFNFNIDYEKIREKLVKENFISKDIKVINMFESLSGDKFEEHVKPIPVLDNDKYNIDPVKDRNCYRYYENGMYKMFVSYEREDDKLKFIDYFNENHYKIRREEFDSLGFKRREIHVDYLSNSALPRQELYYNRSGKCYLNIWYKTVNNSSEIERIHLFKNKEVIVFYKMDDLKKYWLENYLSIDHKNFLIVDGRALDPVVLSLSKPNTYKIFFTHSTHLRPPYSIDSVIRLGNRPVLNNLNEIDALILLTNYQRNDIELRFGKRNNYFVIPHSIEITDNYTNQKVERKRFTAVMMARYHEEKQIDHAIKAFKKVIEVYPLAQLEIYGFGDEEENLKRLILELGLNKNVLLKGFTNSPAMVLEEATLSILTSKYEGFGLAILESLMHGCPLVCYDIKYGPSDMIDNGKNGYLVEPNNIDLLAKKIIELLSDNERLIEFSNNARKKANEFSNERFINDWSNLFNTIIENHSSKINLQSFDFFIEKSDWSSKRNLRYSFEGEISYEGLKDISKRDMLNYRVILRERETKEIIEINSVKGINGYSLHCELLFEEIIQNNNFGEGIWDVNLIIFGNNFYQEKRIGYKKSESAKTQKEIISNHYSNLIFEPYYTNPHGNLSFKVIRK